MWILMKETYSGPAGVFAAGSKMDLPDRVIKQIRKAGIKFEETVPPWETQTDKKAVEKHKAISAANDVRKSIEKTLKLIDQQRGLITMRENALEQINTVTDKMPDDLDSISGKAQDAMTFAAEQTAKAKNQKDKKAAEKLTAEAEELMAGAKSLRLKAARVPFRQKRAEGYRTIAIAEVGLMQIDLGIAAENYDKLAAQAGIEIEEEFKGRVIETLKSEPLAAVEIDTEESTETPEPQSEGTEDGPEPKDSETETGNDGPGESAKADDDAEGQTAKT